MRWWGKVEEGLLHQPAGDQARAVHAGEPGGLLADARIKPAT